MGEIVVVSNKPLMLFDEIDENDSLTGIAEIDCIFLYILYGSSIHIYIPTLYNIFPFASCVTPHNLLQLLYSIPLQG